MTMRAFSNIQVGLNLIFNFDGRRFMLEAKHEQPEFSGIDDIKNWYDGFDVTPSFYNTRGWRRAYEITDDEWAEFERLFAKAYGLQRERLLAAVKQDAERREQRRLEDERKVAEEARRRLEVRRELLDGEGLAVIECLGDHQLDLPNADYWKDNIRKPISKALHDLLIEEFGVVELEPEYDPDEDDCDDDQP